MPHLIAGVCGGQCDKFQQMGYECELNLMPCRLLYFYIYIFSLSAKLLITNNYFKLQIVIHVLSLYLKNKLKILKKKSK